LEGAVVFLGGVVPVDSWRCLPCDATNAYRWPFCAQCGSPRPGPTRIQPADDAVNGDEDSRPDGSDEEAWDRLLKGGRVIRQHRDRGTGVPRTRRARRTTIVAAVLVVAGGATIAAAFLRLSGAIVADPSVATQAPGASALAAPPFASADELGPSFTPSPSRSGPSPSRSSASPATPSGAVLPTSVGMVDVRAAATHPKVLAVGTVFDQYFSGINTRQFTQVMALFDPSGVLDPNDAAQVEAFTRGLSTTTDSQVVLRSITDDPGQAGDLDSRVTFQSRQAAGFGPPGSPDATCTNWDITYQLRPGGGGYRLVRPQSVAHTLC
jgi:hypothetical protein